MAIEVRIPTILRPYTDGARAVEGKGDTLRDLIAAQPERFARGFTEHLIEYALGRPFGFLDEPLADEIVMRANEKNFAITEFIHALAASREFGMK